MAPPGMNLRTSQASLLARFRRQLHGRPIAVYSYAASAYGLQGTTVDASHTMLTVATSTAGVSVGVARGRQLNRLHVVADVIADARAQFVEEMERDRADPGLDHATQHATEAVQGLGADSPVRLVIDELARLAAVAERAERLVERWEQTSGSCSRNETTGRRSSRSGREPEGWRSSTGHVSAELWGFSWRSSWWPRRWRICCLRCWGRVEGQRLRFFTAVLSASAPVSLLVAWQRARCAPAISSEA